MLRSKIFNDATVSNSQVTRETKSLSYDWLIKDEFLRRSDLRFSNSFINYHPLRSPSLFFFLFSPRGCNIRAFRNGRHANTEGKKLRSNLVPPPVILAMNRVAMFEHVAAFPCVRP